jgi:hypothetical protein
MPQIWQRRGMDLLRKYLLCRPQGGLNDMLSEIGKCLAYARKFDRTVIVQSDYFDLTHFNDEFSHYFKSHDERLILSAAELTPSLDAMKCVPDFIEGRVTQYLCKPKTVGIEIETERPVTFDFSKNYLEQLLVHHSNGQQKGRNAIVALNAVVLSDALMEKLKQRSAHLGSNYSSVHIRHTDYKTDYEKRIVELNAKVQGHIFVATDNGDVLKFCQSVLGENRVYSFSKLPDDAGNPLHHLRSADGARQRNEDAVLDLFTLALAKKFYFYPRLIGSFNLRPSYSGFSVLVERLRHEPRLLHRLVTGQDNRDLPNGNKISNAFRQFMGR